MKKFIISLIISYLIISLYSYEPFFMDDPAISPDGELICFVYQDNLWEVPFEGGVARRLTAGSDRIYRPAYSPDRQWIFFHSDRKGRANLFKIPAVGGNAQLVSKEEFLFCDWYPNEAGIFNSDNILGLMTNPGEENSFVRFTNNGLRPLEITEIAESFASVSNNGRYIVFNRRGYPYRMAYEGSHNGDLWLYDVKNKDFARLTETPLTERYPKFSRVNENRIYFLASNGNHFQLCYMEDFNDSTRVQLTNFTEWSPRDISIAHENDRIVFEFFNELWRWDPDKQVAEKVLIEILEDNLPIAYEINNLKNELTDFYISDNNELLVFTHKYDLFAVPVKGGNVKQLTFNQKGIENIVIMNDNETIYYSSHVKGMPKLFKVNINTAVSNNNNEMNNIVKWSEDKYIQSLSKNKQGDLVIRFDKGNERLLFATINQSGKLTEIFPDESLASMPLKSDTYNKYIYTLLNRSNWNRTIRIKDAKSNSYRDIFYSTKYVGNLLLSDDETRLFFNIGSDIYTVNLISETDKKDNNWDNILKAGSTAGGTTKKSTTSLDNNDWDINLHNFNIRSKEIVSDGGFCYPLFATADSTLFYVQRINNNRFLKKVRFDGTKKEEVFNFRSDTSTHQVDKDKRNIYYVQNKNLQRLNINSKKTDLITFEYSYKYDINRLNEEIFKQVWAKFGHNFYDPEMHNQNWDELYNIFSEYAKDIYSPSVLRKVIDEMIGRVNASHTGFYPRREENDKSLNRVYAGFVPDYSERLPVGIRIKKIYHGSELYQNYSIRTHDIVLEINGNPIYANTEISPLFVNNIGGKISLRIQTPSGEVNANVKSLSFVEQRQLQYEDKVLNNYLKVQELTNGRIGYLHIQGMNQPSLRKFEQDFLALNVNTEAMIIDVRGNGGGNIHDQLVDIIKKSQYAYTYSRYFGIEPRPTPHNIYQKPIVCLIDEDSFSDAEIFGVLFKDLNFGKVIGMPTSGSVIGTGTVNFMDGSSMRMPSSGWFRMNMQNMEFNGAVPDIRVEMLPKHIINKQDPQLETAIEVLLSEIGN